MGQTITVTSRPGARPQFRFFGFNRSLTGMGVERYASPADVRGGRPADVLARRLFELGVSGVTVYSNQIGVEAPVSSWGDLEAQVVAVIEHLFEYYGDRAGWSNEARGIAPAAQPDPTPDA